MFPPQPSTGSTCSDTISVRFEQPRFMSQQKMLTRDNNCKRTFHQAFYSADQPINSKFFVEEQMQASLSRACESQTMKRQHLEQRIDKSANKFAQVQNGLMNISLIDGRSKFLIPEEFSSAASSHFLESAFEQRNLFGQPMPLAKSDSFMEE